MKLISKPLMMEVEKLLAGSAVATKSLERFWLFGRKTIIESMQKRPRDGFRLSTFSAG